MTADEMRAILARLQWGYRYAATFSGRSYSRIRKMYAGSQPIDDGFANWLRTVDAAKGQRRAELCRQGAPPSEATVKWERAGAQP